MDIEVIGAEKAEQVVAKLQDAKIGEMAVVEFPQGSHPVREEIAAAMKSEIERLAPGLAVGIRFVGAQPVAVQVKKL